MPFDTLPSRAGRIHLANVVFEAHRLDPSEFSSSLPRAGQEEKSIKAATATKFR
jgi:hypothetical protein